MPFITLITFQAAPLAGPALLKITFITSTILLLIISFITSKVKQNKGNENNS